jgi:hypothetical protein
MPTYESREQTCSKSHENSHKLYTNYNSGYNDDERARFNCMWYALITEPNKKPLMKRNTFMQLRPFTNIVKSSTSTQSPCKGLRKHVRENLGKLDNHPRIKLILARKPSEKMIQKIKDVGVESPSFYRVALLARGEPVSDFHWMKEIRPGVWRHKPGQERVTQNDSEGMAVTDPKEAARAGRLRVGAYPYTFCSYFWVASLETRTQLSRILQLPRKDALLVSLDR